MVFVSEIESSDYQELPESQDEDLIETDFGEMLDPHSIVEETTTSIEMLYLKNLSEGLGLANESTL